MRITEILSYEESNTNNIYLHKEGLFWRAYEVSAYLFITHIKQYQLTKKHYKNVGQEVVYLGSPDSVLDDVLNKIDNKTVRDDKHITIKGYQSGIAQYQEWKSKY